MGVTEIDYVDNNKERLEIAQKLKAHSIYEAYHQVTGKYDLVIDTSATEEGLKTSLRSVRNFGTISSSGIHIKKTRVSLVELYAKGINLKIGLANARADASLILKLLERIEIPFELVTTSLEDWTNAEAAFLKETTKVIVKRERMVLVR